MNENQLIFAILVFGLGAIAAFKVIEAWVKRKNHQGGESAACLVIALVFVGVIYAGYEFTNESTQRGVPLAIEWALGLFDN